jgi:hypothetical protein
LASRTIDLWQFTPATACYPRSFGDAFRVEDIDTRTGRRANFDLNDPHADMLEMPTS